MRIKDIIRTIQDNFYLALIFIIILAIFLAVGYFIIYKNLLKGDKKLSKWRIFIWFCLIGYLIMVIGVTFLNRGSRIFGDTNLHFLSSYREAWNSFNSTKWKFIILNIFMLVPLGILLPLLNTRFRKLKWTLAAAFLMTLTIETAQLITGYGIFELDDIFNNVIGAIIGYGIIMVIITFLEGKKNYKKSIVYLLPLIIVISSSIAIVGIYNSKEFGNLYISHSYKINMKDIDISLNTEIDNESKEVFLNDNKYNISKVPIYEANTYDKESGLEFFTNFLKGKHIEKEIEVDPYNDMAIYWSRGEPSYNMWFYFNGGSYRYKDFSSFDEGIERTDVDKDTVLKELEKFDIVIPDSAIFNKPNDDDNETGIFEWTVENYIDGDYITNGHLSVEYYNDNSIKGINNTIIRYKKTKDVTIKSKKEAYEEFKKGKFNFYKPENINKIVVENISLSYILDSKGFYQPIFNFKVKVDGENNNILIPAI